MGVCKYVARVDTRLRIFPTVRTIKRILRDARRFPVLRPKVVSKRAEVFFSATTERAARVYLATKHGRGSFEASSPFSAKFEKGDKKGILTEFLEGTFFSFDRLFINIRHVLCI